MKRANGSGCITKLSGNRRNPWAIKLTLGYTEDGKLKYKYLSYHHTRRDAEKALALYNQDPFTLSKYTLKELYDEWYATQEKTKATSTLCNHKNALKHMKPLWEVRMNDLDRQELQQFFMRFEGTPSIVHNMVRTLNGLIKYAVKLGVLPVGMLNVLKVIDIVPTKEGVKHKHTLITKEERMELWKRVDEPFVRVILFYIYTGLRYAELYNLDMKNDMFDDHFIIRNSKTEAGKREVPIANFVRTLLPLPEIPCYSIFNVSFHEILPDHKPHDTRHTFVTMLAEKDIDLRVIQSIVGHSRKSTVTDIYTHITLEKKLEAVNSLESTEHNL